MCSCLGLLCLGLCMCMCGMHLVLKQAFHGGEGGCDRVWGVELLAMMSMGW